MAVDSSWSGPKKRWWIQCATTDLTNTAAWKAHERERLTGYLAEINK